MTLYLSREDVIAMHHRLIDRYGGAYGLRDSSALESAMGRLSSGYYTTLIEEAAALWESLSQNHAFIDGNKRIALACMQVFLALNGVQLKATSQEMMAFTQALYDANRFRYANLLPWLQTHT